MYKSICTVGSPASGKTTVALAVAWRLVELKYNVIVINTSSTVPNMPVYLPEMKTSTDGKNSLGTMLESNLSRGQDLFKGRIRLHSKSDKLGFMALTSEETPLTYKSFEKQKLLSLLSLLQSQPVDYLIIDGQSNPVHNSLTLLALECADVVLRTLTPDVKGVEWTKSQLKWLNDSVNIDTSRHIKIANPCRPQSALKEASACIGGYDFILPDNSDTYVSFSSGDKFGGNTSPKGKEFDKQIKKIVERILEQNEV